MTDNQIAKRTALSPNTVAAYIQSTYRNFAKNRNGIFHYILMGHRFAGDDQFLGTGELLGDDVAFNDDCSWNNTPLDAGGLFHELGHNLGLRHGGNDDVNFKPNYLSTMNYQWGEQGIDTNCDGVGDGLIGFSDGSRAPLDENALIEANGICGPRSPDRLERQRDHRPRSDRVQPQPRQRS